MAPISSISRSASNPTSTNLRNASALNRKSNTEAPVPKEAALHRLSGAAYADAQFRHLLDMALKPNITFTVLPFSANLYPGMSGFTLLDFPPGMSAAVVYYEHIVGGRVEQDRKVVGQLSELYDELTGFSMSPDEAIAFLERWIEEQLAWRSGLIFQLSETARIPTAQPCTRPASNNWCVI